MADLESDLMCNPQSVCEGAEQFLRESLEHMQADGFVLGLSGGVDSAVAAAFICKTIGPESLLGILLPDVDSSPQSERDARLVAEHFGFPVRKRNISRALKKLRVYDLFWPIHYLPRFLKEKVYEKERAARDRAPGEVFLETRLGTEDKDLRKFNAYIRAKGRMRTLALYIPAEIENRLVVGTSNYSEYIIGWFTKWGDALGDVQPIVDLYKTQVWEMAKNLGVPQPIIDKRPSPDLIAGMFDEDGIGLPYRTLDLVLAGINRGMGDEKIAEEAGVPVERVGHVHELIQRSQHMRDMPPFPKLGTGKQIFCASDIKRRPQSEAEAAE